MFAVKYVVTLVDGARVRGLRMTAAVAGTVLLLAGCGADPGTPATTATSAVTDPVLDAVANIEPSPTEPASTTIPPTTVAPITTTTAPLVIRLTDPLALASILDRAAQATLGRNAPAEDKPLFVEYFHADERAQQVAAHNGAAYYVPDAPAAATQWLRQRHPDEAGAHALAEQGQTFKGILDGANSDRFPSTTTTAATTTTTTTSYFTTTTTSFFQPRR